MPMLAPYPFTPVATANPMTTVGTSAAGLTNWPGASTYAVISNVGSTVILWRDDGTAPTTSVYGGTIPAGGVLPYYWFAYGSIIVPPILFICASSGTLATAFYK